VLYYTAGPHFQGETSLLEMLRAGLPSYMVPAVLEKIDKMPNTANGKVDRKELAMRSLLVNTMTHESQGEDILTEEEASLLAIWREVVGSPTVGVEDNYFEIGGDSITAMQIVSRARSVGISMSLGDMFLHQTVREILRHVVSPDRRCKKDIPHALAGGSFPLSPIQQWLVCLAGDHLNHYNQAIMLESATPLRPDLLQAALMAMVDHHDSLRIRFDIVPGEPPGQFYSMGVDSGNIAVHDLHSHQSLHAREIELVANTVQASMNLKSGPVIRGLLFSRQPPLTDLLLLAAHHMVVDGVSWRILLEDLESSYLALDAGASEIRLPAKSNSYSQWVEYIGSRQSMIVEEEIRGWVQALSRDRPSLGFEEGVLEGLEQDSKIHSLQFSEQKTSLLLKGVSRSLGAGLEPVLLCGLLFGLDAFDITVDVERHGRGSVSTDLDFSRTVGWFTSLFPVRLEVSSREIAKAIAMVNRFLNSVPEPGISFGIAKYLLRAPDLWNDSLVKPAAVCFNYLGQFQDSVSESGFFSWSDAPIGAIHSPQMKMSHALTVNAVIQARRLQIEFSFSPGCFTDDQLQAIDERYRQFIEGVLLEIQNCKRREQAQNLSISRVELDRFLRLKSRKER
jgi:non-ribosomal peptide synthase protein (TIGR01720 family)